MKLPDEHFDLAFLIGAVTVFVLFWFSYERWFAPQDPTVSPVISEQSFEVCVEGQLGEIAGRVQARIAEATDYCRPLLGPGEIEPVVAMEFTGEVAPPEPSVCTPCLCASEHDALRRVVDGALLVDR